MEKYALLQCIYQTNRFLSTIRDIELICCCFSNFSFFLSNICIPLSPYVYESYCYGENTLGKTKKLNPFPFPLQILLSTLST